MLLVYVFQYLGVLFSSDVREKQELDLTYQSGSCSTKGVAVNK